MSYNHDRSLPNEFYDYDYKKYEYRDGDNSEGAKTNVNGDLIDFDVDDIFSSMSSGVPLIECLSLHGLDDLHSAINYSPGLEIQSSMNKPYFLLEFSASVGFYLGLYIHGMITTMLIAKNTEEAHLRLTYIFCKSVNFALLAAFLSLFTSADTYKSLNLTIEILMVNAVIFKYSVGQTFIYFITQLSAMIISSLIAIGIFHTVINDIPASTIITASVPSDLFNFNTTTLFISVLMHICIATGLTLITNSTSSLNAFTRSIHKSVFLFFVSVVFGILVDSLGAVLPTFILYTMWSMITNEYTNYNVDLLKIIAISLVVIVVCYPLIAIYTKYVLRKKYLRYIEYGHLS